MTRASEYADRHQVMAVGLHVWAADAQAITTAEMRTVVRLKLVAEVQL